MNDKRNWTAVPQLDKYNNSVEDAYYWVIYTNTAFVLYVSDDSILQAALQAIERCKSESTRVVIYTDCDALCDSKH